MAVYIAGWGHSKFGRLDNLDLEALITSVARDAVNDAGVPFEDIEAAWLGNLNGGFIPDNFCSSLILQTDPRLRWAPATRVENACASGSAAIYSACDAIESGRVSTALVVGAEKMTSVAGEDVTRILGNASYVKQESAQGLSFPGIFARIAREYFAKYGDHSDVLARIAAKNHANGVRNPWAQLRRDLGFEFCNTVSDKNPLVADPLRKTDCSLVSDGAAALVLVGESRLKDVRRAVKFRARAQVSDFLPMAGRDVSSFAGPRRAWSNALNTAGCQVTDLDLAEVHDCFTMAELLIYEAMGLARAGEGRRVIEDGTVMPGGSLPINPSGGLKSKGHPIGATGVSMHAIAAMQLCGEAGDMQVRDAGLAAVFNMGGSAVANYTSILERAK